MKIGELADATGLTRDTIRFYERNGLIQSEAGKQATNTYRNYPEELVFRLQIIQQARDAGVSVSDIKAVFDALDGSCDPADAKGVVAAKIEELEASKQQIENTIAFFKEQLAKL